MKYKYVIVKQALDDSFEETEEIEADNMDAVFLRASDLMSTTNFRIHIYDKEDYLILHG